jgi:hypothetical protein
MGLDLFCGDHGGIKMGSYSMVHEIRLHWIKAFIKYLNSINEICPPLNNSIQKGDIDYREFEKIKCNQQGFQGLFVFVNHSDCEGIWTPEEIEDIMTTLNLIRLYLKDITYEWHFQETEYYLEDLFNYSIETHEIITFS